MPMPTMPVQNPMVDLSGMQGRPTSQGMGVAGLMAGFGGMAAQGYMAALGKGYQAAMAQNAQRAPMMQQALPGQGQSVRALNAITDAPQPQNSLQASSIAQNNPMMNQSVAGMSNGYYSPPDSVNQGRAYGLTLPMDLVGQQNRNANQNPMYAGMQGRFGAGSTPGQQAAMISQNEAAGNIRLRGDFGEMPTYVEKGEEPQVQYRSNKNGDQVSYIPRGRDPVLDRQMSNLAKFQPNAERAANRREAKAKEQDRRDGVKFKHMVSRGMNPMSDQARALFPNQVAKMNGQTLPGMNPMGSPGTVESQQAGLNKVSTDMVSNPHIVAMGGKPDATLADINSGVSAHLASGGTFSDESLKAFQEHAKAQGATKTDEYNPFVMGPSDGGGLDGQMWAELAVLPDTPEARSDWVARYKDREKERAARAADSLRRNPPRAGA